MKPNSVQKLYEKDNPKLIPFTHNNEIILKARQLGFSTYIAGKFFVNTINTPLTQSMMIAQDEVNSKRLFEMVRRFYNNLPPHKKRKAEVTQESIYFPDIDSFFFVGWAGSRKLGRGGTINNLHWSETAFAESARDIVLGLLQAVPQSGNKFLESTANGVGNYYYKEYMAAMRGESIYTHRFYPWFLMEEYTSDHLYGSEAFVINSDEEELQQQIYDEYQITLTDGQLIWRRNKILELKNASIADEKVGDFVQEYPSTIMEAFIATGSSFFDGQHLVKVCQPRCLKNDQIPDIHIPIQFSELNKVNSRKQGKLSLYFSPQPGHRYLVTGDPSEGLNLDGDHDYCSSDVIDVTTGKQVGTLHGRWEPNEYAQLLYELGMFYNCALLVIERNNHGHAVLNHLLHVLDYPADYNLPWGGIYHHKEYDTNPRRQNSVLSRKPGYPTTVKSKPIALNALYNSVKDDSLIIYSLDTIEQMRTYSKLPGGKYGGVGGHDDRVTSISIGAAILQDVEYNKEVMKRTYSSKKARAFPKKRRAVGFV